MNTKTIHRTILKLAVPSILANITIPLVGLVDTAIVGHISSAVAIGGIAIGTMLFDLLYWNFGFLRVGTSGMTAQAYGRGDKTECARLLTQSLGIAAVATVAIWLIQWLFVEGVLACVPCSEEVSSFARQYFYIRIWAAPATLGLMALKGWFIGMQDTVSPMVCDVVVNVVNMAVSYYLAVCTPIGAIGVAWGTLAAQWTGLILALTILAARYREVFRGLPVWHTLTDVRGMRRLLVLNTNLFVRSLCFMVVYVGFTSLASHYGDVELAVSTILMKLFMLVSYLVDGFAYAGEALVGRAIGEIQQVRTDDETALPLRQVIRVLLLWATLIGMACALAFVIWGDEAVYMMTTDPAVNHTAHGYGLWLWQMPLIGAYAFIFDGIFVGATEGRYIRNSMIVAAAAFVGAYVLCYRWAGATALYVAYIAHLYGRALYLGLKWKKAEEHALSHR